MYMYSGLYDQGSKQSFEIVHFFNGPVNLGFTFPLLQYFFKGLIFSKFTCSLGLDITQTPSLVHYLASCGQVKLPGTPTGIAGAELKEVNFNFFFQAGSAKELKKISEWSDHIINHFWYCCEVASKDTTSDEEALSKMKVICHSQNFTCRLSENPKKDKNKNLLNGGKHDTLQYIQKVKEKKKTRNGG